MSIVLVSSGGGQITLEEPTTASNFTQTLPAATGTAILANTSGDLQINSGFGSNATAYGCRAWVNFNGTGTVAIRGSGNVSSITDNGVGDYTVNFTAAMPDTNYASLASTLSTSNLTGGGFAATAFNTNTASAVKTTSANRFIIVNNADTALVDVDQVNYVVFR